MLGMLGVLGMLGQWLARVLGSGSPSAYGWRYAPAGARETWVPGGLSWLGQVIRDLPSCMLHLGRRSQRQVCRNTGMQGSQAVTGSRCSHAVLSGPFLVVGAHDLAIAASAASAFSALATLMEA